MGDRSLWIEHQGLFCCRDQVSPGMLLRSAVSRALPATASTSGDHAARQCKRVYRADLLIPTTVVR